MTAIAPDQEYRQFSFCCDALETGLDFLSSITKRGHQVLKAELIDQEQRIILPPDAFDGSLFTEPFRQLESEWQSILGDPVTPPDTWRTDLLRQQIRSCQLKQRYYNQMIGELEAALQQAHTMPGDTVRRATLTQRFEQMLRLNQCNQASNWAYQKGLLEQLAALEAGR